MEEKNGNIPPPAKWMYQPGKKWIEILALLVIVLAILLPRVFRLDEFATTDEQLWLTRSANFYYALTHGDFAHTYQRQHPGVMAMWAGTAGFLLRYPEYRGTGLGQIGYFVLEKYLSDKPVSPMDILAGGRLFIVLGNTFALAVAYLYARRLIGFIPAVLGFLLIAFDPFHIALTRVLHLDGTLSSLMLTALLAFLSYLRGWRLLDLLVAGLCSGLSWLTKSPGLFLLPIFGLLVLYELWRKWSARADRDWLRLVWRYTWPSITVGVLGALVFFTLWPAMWINPRTSVRKVFSMANRYAGEGHSSPVFFNGRIFEDGKIGADVFYFYPLTILWRSTPVILVGLALLLVALIVRRNYLKRAETGFTLLGMSIFVVIFLLVMNLGGKKFDRYAIPVYPMLDIMAAIGWVGLASWLVERGSQLVSRYVVPAILLGVVAVQMLVTLPTFPYYFSYYNPLMGGAKKAPEVMLIGWGEGLEKAAQYLQAKPNADQLIVASWYGQGSFSYFFDGRVETINATEELVESKYINVISADYAVIYIHQWQRGIPERLLNELAPLEPEKTIWVDGIEYARIYDLSDLRSMQ